MKPSFSIPILLVLALAARADVGRIDANAPLPKTNQHYLVVALPANWQQHPKTAELVRGLKAEPKQEGITVYWYWPESPHWPDWKHRFQKRIPDTELPVVMAMDGSKVTFKKSNATLEDIAGGVQGGRRIFPRLFPNCPGPNCPDNDPYDPNTPEDGPYQPGPDLQPIPDTEPAAPIPDTVPQVDYSAIIAQLEARIALLEARQLEKGPKGDKGDPGPAGKDAIFDLNAVVAEVQKRLTHSLELTLLSGQKQFQTRPLSEPLQLNQRTVSAKP